jgi:DNA-binding NarL/FixJ family response regulator
MSPKQDHAKAGPEETLLLELACGASYHEAAKRAAVSVATVKRRMANLLFRRQVSKLRAEMLAQASGKLASSATAAVAVLVDIASDKEAGVRDRLSAARAVLEHAQGFSETLELAERVCAIEEHLGMSERKGQEQLLEPSTKAAAN